MLKRMANNKCKECDCYCSGCASDDQDVHLHVEIENLKQRLVERDNHIVTMETNFLNEANKYPSGELMALRDELITWQDKYKRLYEAHRRVQRVNQGLEDKLLRLVDVTETEKGTLTKDVATLSHKLAEANYKIKKLTLENERYKNDVSLAIQFLQCKPGNFVSQKFDTLPNEVQAKVSTYMTNKRKPEEKKSNPEMKSIKVPIPTFPPTAMVYSIPKSPSAPRKFEEEAETSSVDIVSAAIMAKVLEERELERACIKHCDTCMCSKTPIVKHNVSIQTFDSSKTDSKIKSVQLHDYNEPNVVKVEPNNFLADVKSVKKVKTVDVPQINLGNNTNTKSAVIKSVKATNNQMNKVESIGLETNSENTQLGLDKKIFAQNPQYVHCSRAATSISENANSSNDLINLSTIVKENANKKSTSHLSKSKKALNEVFKGSSDQKHLILSNRCKTFKDTSSKSHEISTENHFANTLNNIDKTEVPNLQNISLIESTPAIKLNQIDSCNKSMTNSLEKIINQSEINAVAKVTNSKNLKTSVDNKHLQNFNYLSSTIPDYEVGNKCTLTKESNNFVNNQNDHILIKSAQLHDVVVLNPTEISILNETLKQDKIKHTLHGTKNSVLNSNPNFEYSTSQDCPLAGLSSSSSNKSEPQPFVSNSNVQNVSNNILLDNIEVYEPKITNDVEVNMERYKEMEDNVKRFLFGEVNIVSTLNVGKCDTLE